MNLKEAERLGKLDEFIKEHEIKDPHPMGQERLEALLDLMTRGTPTPAGTCGAAPSASYGGTRTRKGTFEDASG
jgi:hypothetical protein